MHWYYVLVTSFHMYGLLYVLKVDITFVFSSSYPTLLHTCMSILVILGYFKRGEKEFLGVGSVKKVNIYYHTCCSVDTAGHQHGQADPATRLSPQSADSASVPDCPCCESAALTAGLLLLLLAPLQITV